jgi:hypothetical protein
VTVESGVDAAWDVHDIVTGSGPPRPPEEEVNPRDLAAIAARSWATNCRKDGDFERLLPSLMGVAEVVNPRLDSESAMRVWRVLSDSPCGKALAEPQRRWLDLFQAVAQRDVAGMASTGGAILEATKGKKNSVTEYAFFATVTALACQGETARARDLINGTRESWVRDKTRDTEMRFLVSMTSEPGVRRGVCAAGAHS